jgi:hypothetical protein
MVKYWFPPRAVAAQTLLNGRQLPAKTLSPSRFTAAPDAGPGPPSRLLWSRDSGPPRTTTATIECLV